ncbi:tRNA-dihydrouridine synthase [Helicobacter equorum]|uniref:tRNA-dihydrouridine synthase n=1 Tax=Helicobacter equorum TaxID=361872 RepID=UPI000CF12D36|nr:tRNA-dihydrouridine synthase [Helicobacter equorum]
MIGRGAIGKPWIFSLLKAKKNLAKMKKKELIKEHFALALKHYENHAVAMMRKHLHEYSKGLDGAPVFRTKINAEQNADEVLKLIDEFF